MPSPEGCRRVVVDPVCLSFTVLHCASLWNLDITDLTKHIQNCYRSSMITSSPSNTCNMFTQNIFRSSVSEASGDMGWRLDAGRGISGASNPGESPLQFRLRSDDVRCFLSEFPHFLRFSRFSMVNFVSSDLPR